MKNVILTVLLSFSIGTIYSQHRSDHSIEAHHWIGFSNHGLMIGMEKPIYHHFNWFVDIPIDFCHFDEAISIEAPKGNISSYNWTSDKLLSYGFSVGLSRSFVFEHHFLIPFIGLKGDFITPILKDQSVTTCYPDWVYGKSFAYDIGIDYIYMLSKLGFIVQAGYAPVHYHYTSDVQYHEAHKSAYRLGVGLVF